MIPIVEPISYTRFYYKYKMQVNWKKRFQKLSSLNPKTRVSPITILSLILGTGDSEESNDEGSDDETDTDTSTDSEYDSDSS